MTLHKPQKFSYSAIVALFSVLLIATVALADAVQIHYRTLGGDAPAPVAAQDNITSSQSDTWSDTPIDPKATNGNPKIAVYGEFTSNAGTTIGVTVGLYTKDRDTGDYTFLGVAAVGTLSNSWQASPNGYAALAPLEVDTRAAPYYDLRVTGAPGTGATVKHFSFGAARRDGE